MLILDKAKWYDGADVVVVGYGGGGGVAAVAAHDAGADVLILEKQPADTHVNSTTTAGGMFISPPDARETEDYLRAMANVDKDMFWTDPEIIKVWAEYSCQNKAWVEKMGGKVTLASGLVGLHREIPGYEHIRAYGFSGGGRGFMAFFKKLASERKIKTLYGIKARRLITNQQGEVIGVTAQKEDGAEINIKAARAVILASGGFEFNETMKLQFLRCYPLHFTGSVASTGDGVRMAMGVGADLWHMNCVTASFAMKFPEVPVAIRAQLRPGEREEGTHDNERFADTRTIKPVCGYIVVDKNGRRFTNENFKEHHISYELAMYDSRSLSFPRIPAYWIMDQRRIEDSPLARAGGGAANFYKWSRDNKTELAKGWISSADDINELGRKLGIEAGNLVKTIRDYNSYCHNGTDPEFRRRPQSLIPLDTPPYYAVKLWPGGSATQGGPRRNHKAQVIGVEGNPIPGLYASGELGSVIGMLYTGAANLAECISFGRIAGEYAAREKSRSIT